MPAKLGARAPLRRRLARVGVLAAIAALLPACEGGSGQSGSAFTFLTVDGFSLTPGSFVSSVPSSTAPGTTTTACVTLRNNLKNPTVTASTALDNIIVQSYTVTITSLSGGNLGTFTIGTAVLVPSGATTITNGQTTTTPGTATFSVLLVPSESKGSPGTVANVLIRFRGHDQRGSSVQAEGGVAVVFTSGLAADSSCGSSTGTGGGGGTGGTGGTTTQ